MRSICERDSEHFLDANPFESISKKRNENGLHYFGHSFQFQNGNFQSVVIKWPLRICYHDDEIFLQFQWQL